MDVDLALLVLIVLFAYMIGATTGFGGAMIAMALGVHLYSVDFLVPVIVLLNLAISIYIVARYHDGIDYPQLFRRILPIAGLGLPVGIILFDVAKTDTLRLVLGAVVVCFSLFELIVVLASGRDARPRPMGNLQSTFWLFSAGVMHGMYASGGPMAVYYASRNIPDKRVFRSTLSALWLVLNLVLLVVHLSTGKLTAESAWYGVVLLPALAVGIAAGEWLHTRLPERTFRIVVFAVLAVAGATVFL